MNRKETIENLIDQGDRVSGMIIDLFNKYKDDLKSWSKEDFRVGSPKYEKMRKSFHQRYDLEDQLREIERKIDDLMD